MGKVSILILLLVVMGHGSARCDLVDNPSQLDGDHQAPRAASDEAQEGADLKLVLSNLPALGNQAKTFGFVNRDDDHSNIELDNLAAYRYDVLPTTTALKMAIDPTEAAVASDAGTANGLARLFSKIAVNRLDSNDLSGRAQWLEQKRNFRDLGPAREDKDYSFVGMPITSIRYNGQQQQQQRDGKWAAQILRDMILSRGKALRFASGRNNQIANLDQLSQATRYRLLDPSVKPSGGHSLETAPDSMPGYREKRRRCKLELHSSVKNPLHCDSDSFFGANDYLGPAVWETAGKRR